jgi:hypothetical protein
MRKKKEFKGIELSEKQRRSIERARKTIESAGLGTYMSAPASNAMSGIIRYGPSSEKAEMIQKEKREMANHGRKFIDGPKKPRQDKLGKEIENTYLALKNNHNPVSARDIWNALQENDVIQECENIVQVDGEPIHYENYNIYWKGELKEKTTSFKAFQHRLSKIKKKHLS